MYFQCFGMKQSNVQCFFIVFYFWMFYLLGGKSNLLLCVELYEIYLIQYVYQCLFDKI